MQLVLERRHILTDAMQSSVDNKGGGASQQGTSKGQGGTPIRGLAPPDFFSFLDPGNKGSK